MASVKVVSAYVDLGLTKRPSKDFYRLGDQLERAVGEHIKVFRDFSFPQCWAVGEFGNKYPPANPLAPDRFVDVDEHLRSNLIQHSPLQWLQMALDEDPTPDVFVWMGYSIMKQGEFTGKLITEQIVSEFLQKVSVFNHGTIPIPSIRPYDRVEPYGDNWQFVGSTIIAPRKYLCEMLYHYKTQLRAFVAMHSAIPLDLAIWPTVVRQSGLPFEYYGAEYDATQLTGFPG